MRSRIQTSGSAFLLPLSSQLVQLSKCDYLDSPCSEESTRAAAYSTLYFGGRHLSTQESTLVKYKHILTCCAMVTGFWVPFLYFWVYSGFKCSKQWLKTEIMNYFDRDTKFVGCVCVCVHARLGELDISHLLLLLLNLNTSLSHTHKYTRSRSIFILELDIPIGLSVLITGIVD